MGILDQISGALKGVMGQTEGAGPGLIFSALAKSNLGDLQVKSWLGNGSNLPISADQLRAALGNAQVQHLAEHFGLPIDQTLNLLSTHLPTVVDQASPNGTIESQ